LMKRLMKKFNELWLGVFGLLSIFIFIEGLHVNFHSQGKARSEEPQCRTSD